MKILKKTEDKIVFSTKMNESLANAIRRSIGLIPILAIDEIEIEQNNSPLYDESLAHRMGLIPIKTPKKIEEGKDIILKLKSKNPGYIYSGEITGDLEVVYDKIPLTYLDKDQEIKIKAIVRVGYGRDHAKFSPGILTYRKISEITLPKKYKGKILEKFPENEIKEKGDKIIIKDDKVKTLIDFCEGLCNKDKEKCEVQDLDEIIFSVESFGQISPEEIFKQSVEFLKKDLKNLKINIFI